MMVESGKKINRVPRQHTGELRALLCAALVLCGGAANAADPVVSAVSTVVKGNEHLTTVEVTFTLSDADGDDCHIAVFGHDTVTHQHFPMTTFLEGDIFSQSFAPGTHTVTWVASLDQNPGADWTNVGFAHNPM